ncbi:Zn(II)2Cys6 transcription factor domain-containing protein [Aspergillus undulatus]|uniref:Zn(II)2Cys6 transcription factor domain-containing protein n=1 Tax=Aspergillus undulatus TaxID=1810928 RepID=UPI003CCD2521
MPQRACDRCYTIKVKCQQGRTPSACHRCERLGHHCQTLRQIRPAGRRPKPPVASVAAWGRSTSLMESSDEDTMAITSPTEEELEDTESMVSTYPSPISGVSMGPAIHPDESPILHFLFSTAHFIPHFVIGPSFASRMQISLKCRFFISPSILLEGFLACAGEFAQKTGTATLPTTNKQNNMTRCTSALSKLRSLHATDLESIRDTLALGMSILTYDQLAACDMGTLTGGAGTRTVCRYILSTAAPWYGRLSAMPEMDFELNCLIYIDTVECLAQRRIPVLRMRVRDERVVDRYIGLCVSLLPVLYDVCVLASRIRENGSGFVKEIEGGWDGFRAAVAGWQPTPPDGFTALYTPVEVISMLTQANVYRLLGLLILHRLRYPFGTEDGIGIVYAEAIIAEVETCERVTGASPFKAGFALLIAGFEVRDVVRRERLIRMYFGARSGHHAQTHASVRRLFGLVWGEKDSSDGVSWFDVAATMPNFRYIL